MKPAFSEEILTAYNRKDPGAFARVFSAFYPAIHAYINKQLHSDPAAKDLTADSFVRLWEYQGRFKHFSGLRAFLFETAKNLALDYLRHSKTEKEKLKEIGKLNPDSPTANPPFAETHAELLRRVNRAIEFLPRQCRQIFLLYYTKGLTNTEIASQLNISTKTVSNQKTIALRELRLRLTKMRSISVPILFSAACHLGSLLRFFKH